MAKRLTCSVGLCKSPAVTPTLGMCEFHAYAAEMGTERASAQAHAAQVAQDRNAKPKAKPKGGKRG